MHDTRAVIDIGSNTVRLVIYSGPARAPVEMLNEKVSARLGRGLVTGSRLSDKSMAAALSALERFALLLRMKGIQRVDTVATAAVREAANGGAFLERVAALGLSPRLLSGAEEAAMSAAGVIGAFPGARGTVADLGGGSLELAAIAQGAVGAAGSLPFGSLRLAALRESGGREVETRLAAMLDEAGLVLPRGADAGDLYLVGGSFRALARAALPKDQTASGDAHGTALTGDAASALCRDVLRGKYPANLPGVSASRMAALPDAAALLAALVRIIRPARVVFSGWGLREGLIFHGLSPALQQQDPLVAGVGAFAESMNSSPSAAAIVTGWTAGVVPGNAGQEHLRLAATMLALASQRVEPNLRAQAILDWALRKRWIGVDLQGRAMLAAAALANGNRACPERLTELADAAALGEAAAWGLATRLCRRFSGLAIDALSNSRLAVEDDRLLLCVRPSHAALVTEMAVKDLALLAGRLGLEPDLRIAAHDPVGA